MITYVRSVGQEKKERELRHQFFFSDPPMLRPCKAIILFSYFPLGASFHNIYISRLPFLHKYSMAKREANNDSTSENPQKKQAPISSWFQPPTKPSIARSLTSVAKDSPSSVTPGGNYRVYCDLDGVLVDFEAGVRKLLQGRGPDDVKSSSMWAAISRADRFYYNLPWTKDGKDLWNAIRHLRPHILTGVPMLKQSREDKAQWCKRELGAITNHVDMAGPKSTHTAVTGRKSHSLQVVNVITCWSRNKHMESGTNS